MTETHQFVLLVLGNINILIITSNLGPINICPFLSCVCVCKIPIDDKWEFQYLARVINHLKSRESTRICVDDVDHFRFNH